MMKEVNSNIVYSKEVIEFTTVAVEYCIFMEKFDTSISLKEFSQKLLKLLPMIYLKTQSLSNLQSEDNIDDDGLEVSVTQADYDYIQDRCKIVLAASDDYLEVFHSDMQYSDTPIIAFVSENLADIYQDLRNYAAIFERGNEKLMQNSLYACLENFKIFWGQTLVNVLRAIHSIEYKEYSTNMFDDL